MAFRTHNGNAPACDACLVGSTRLEANFGKRQRKPLLLGRSKDRDRSRSRGALDRERRGRDRSHSRDKGTDSKQGRKRERSKSRDRPQSKASKHESRYLLFKKSTLVWLVAQMTFTSGTALAVNHVSAVFSIFQRMLVMLHDWFHNMTNLKSNCNRSKEVAPKTKKESKKEKARSRSPKKSKKEHKHK